MYIIIVCLPLSVYLCRVMDKCQPGRVLYVEGTAPDEDRFAIDISVCAINFLSCTVDDHCHISLHLYVINILCNILLDCAC